MSKVVVGSVPNEALSEGGLNATTPPEQRVARANVEKTEGPKLHQTGAFLPAEYTRTRTVMTKAGPVEQTITRRDR